MHLLSVAASVLLTLTTHATVLSAQVLQVQLPSASAADHLTVTLITFGPGESVLSRFGHSALWIRDELAGTNYAYNYGFSNTQDPQFLSELVRGDVTFRPVIRNAFDLMNAYAEHDRTVLLQELNLSAADEFALQAYLQRDAQPSALPYVLDFYKTNCTTELRDALDLVLGGQIRAMAQSQRTEATYRSLSLQYASGDPLLYIGLLVGLSSVADHWLTVWDQMFLPSMLRQSLRDVVVRGDSGQLVALVKAETTWYKSTQAGRSATGLSKVAFLVVGMSTATVFIGLGYLTRASETKRLARVAFAGLASIWLVLTGVLGAILLGLWAITGQYLAHSNENLFVMNPAALLAAWLFLRGASLSETEEAPLRWLVSGLAVVALVGITSKAIPGFEQANGPLLAATVPGYLGLAGGMWLATPSARNLWEV